MEIKGTIHLIEDEKQVSEKFKKRLIVIKTEEQFPQLVPIDFTQDKCSLLDKYKVGQQSSVSVNVRGNEYKGKFYVNFQGWKIDAEEALQTEETNDLPW